ncbi:MAG: S9 family peptidase [Anaerolineae bacterium]|nr:S9 family peptidase [Anaerolineae bacterium]
MPTKQAFGTWSSPFSPKAYAEMLSLNDVQWDGDTLVWHENRGPRGVLVAQTGTEAPRDLTGELSARGAVGYGGGAFTVGHGHVYFGIGSRLYRQPLNGGIAKAITPSFGEVAAPRLSADGKWLLYVYSYEHHDGLALVDAEGKSWPSQFATGTDFIMQPAWHPVGEYAAYIAWNHPNMPWDVTELRFVTLEYDRAGVPGAASTETIVGGVDNAIFQPEFSPDGRYLAYVSDQTGWNQLYFYDIQSRTHTQLTTVEADHATPAWIQGLRVYGWTADSKSILYLRNEQGFISLWRVDITSQQSSRLPGLEAYTDLGQIAVAAEGHTLAVIAANSQTSPRVVSLDFSPPAPPALSLQSTEQPSIAVVVGEEKRERIHRRASGETLPASALAEAEAIEWAGHDGETAYGLYYAPKNERFEGTGAPPLIVYVHGGPTSQVRAGFSVAAQVFATRGFAVFMVNHRGSTGYGKAYMNKLRGNWGIYDVEDSASGAAYLAAQGKADPRRFVILGGSAGGYTVLQSLVDKPGFYKAGVCLYGVSNQFSLAMDTHKFEERYSDSLLGPLPEAADLYRERSPLFHADKIVDPMIVFQGEDDKVVVKSQSDSIVEALRRKGIPHEYHVYAGEGHGWRKPETIEHYYNATLNFLKQHVVFA